TFGTSVDPALVREAIRLMNQAEASGCLREGVLAYAFKSLHNIDGAQVKNALEAYNRYVAGKPYRLDVFWYLKRLSGTIGYTYNYTGAASETRIWTNTKFITGPKMLAAHYAHELS